MAPVVGGVLQALCRTLFTDRHLPPSPIPVHPHVFQKSTPQGRGQFSGAMGYMVWGVALG